MGNSSGKQKAMLPSVQVTPSPRTLHELIASRIAEHGTKVAQVDSATGDKMTFDAITERSAALAAGLTARGLRPGDAALIIGENNIHYPWVLLGVLQTGASAHLVNPRSTPREVEHAMSISRPQMALVSSVVSKEEGVAAVLRDAACVRHVLVWGSGPSENDLPDGISSLEQLLVSPAKSASSECSSPPRDRPQTEQPTDLPASTVLEVKAGLVNVTPAAPPPTPTSIQANYGCSPALGRETSPLQRILQPAVDGLPSGQVVGGGSVALILSSSGSTGLPKGVMLTHDNLLAALELGPLFVRPDDVVLGISPYFHAYGGVLMLMALVAGVPMVALGRFSMEAVFRAVQEHSVTVMHVVSSLLVSLSKQEPESVARLAPLRRLWSGAAQVSPLVQSALQSRLPDVKLFHSYGMTETTFTTFCGEVRADKPGSPGTLVRGMECKVVDPDTGKTLPMGSRGELCFRGQMVMRGYLGNPEATNEVLDQDGWLFSGDLGFVDEDGYYYIVERLKDILKYNGHQVSPSELEALLITHPAVSEAAVIGEPHEYGEAPRALVILAEGAQVTPQELQEYIAGKVAPHKQLRGGISFVSCFPRTASGKLQRKKLRALLLEDADSSISSSTLTAEEASMPNSPEPKQTETVAAPQDAAPAPAPAPAPVDEVPAEAAGEPEQPRLEEPTSTAGPEDEGASACEHSQHRPSVSSISTNSVCSTQDSSIATHSQHRPSVSSISTNSVYSTSTQDSSSTMHSPAAADSSAPSTPSACEPSLFAANTPLIRLQQASQVPLPDSPTCADADSVCSGGSGAMDFTPTLPGNIVQGFEGLMKDSSNSPSVS